MVVTNAVEDAAFQHQPDAPGKAAEDGIPYFPLPFSQRYIVRQVRPRIAESKCLPTLQTTKQIEGRKRCGTSSLAYHHSNIMEWFIITITSWDDSSVLIALTAWKVRINKTKFYPVTPILIFWHPHIQHKFRVCPCLCPVWIMLERNLVKK